MVKVEGHYNTSGYFIENYFADNVLCVYIIMLILLFVDYSYLP